MSRGLNRVMLIGVLGRDPEMRYTPAGQAVTSFSLATEEDWGDGAGARRTSTEWFNVVAWGDLAERTHATLKKSETVYVEGRLQTRSWEDDEGNRNYLTEVVASDVISLSDDATPDQTVMTDEN